MKRTRRTEQQWIEMIHACRTSGFSDREWCEQNHISINTFYNKISLLRKKSCEFQPSLYLHHDTEPEIVPLTVLDELPSETTSTEDFPVSPEPISAVKVTYKGVTVELQNHACRDLIRNTFLALQQL